MIIGRAKYENLVSDLKRVVDDRGRLRDLTDSQRCVIEGLRAQLAEATREKFWHVVVNDTTRYEFTDEATAREAVAAIRDRRNRGSALFTLEHRAGTDFLALGGVWSLRVEQAPKPNPYLGLY